MDNQSGSLNQYDETRKPRHSLFRDEPVEKKPDLIVESQSTSHHYFQNVPLVLLLIFAWFSYNAFRNLFGSFTSLYYLTSTGQLMLGQMSFFGSQPIWLTFIPIPLALAYFALLWGLVKQEAWTKIVLLVWYGVVLVMLGYNIFPVLNNIGYNSSNEFYSQGGLNYYSYVVFAGAFVSLAINTYIAYYLFKKVTYNN